MKPHVGKTKEYDPHDDGNFPSNLWLVQKCAELIGRPFTLDVAADADNHKAPKRYDRQMDGRLQEWAKDAGEGGAIWVNVNYADLNVERTPPGSDFPPDAIPPPVWFSLSGSIRNLRGHTTTEARSMRRKAISTKPSQTSQRLSDSIQSWEWRTTIRG